jgi:hypothetical protein
VSIVRKCVRLEEACVTGEEAARWLVLDNLKSKWHFTVNLPLAQARAALRWCREKGYVDVAGMITPGGEAALLVGKLS